MISGPYNIKPVLMDLPDDPTWKARCDNAITYCNNNGITDIERIHGVYGKSWKVSGSPDNIYLLDNKPEEKFFIGQGKVSNFLTHTIMMNACLRMQEDYFLFIECDVQLVDNWKDKLDTCLNDLAKHDPNWDLFFAGSCCAQDKNPQQIKDNLYFWPYLGEEKWQYGPQCNHFWIVAKKCIKIILDTNVEATAPWDISMLKNTSKYLKIYGALPRLAYQTNTHLPE